MDDYDFSQYIVAQCLPDVSGKQDDKFICCSCHKKLQETNDENALVPYHVKNKCVTAAANFLKTLQEKPEYVCTCCHQMLFCKTVQSFNITDYNMKNNIVRKCLSFQYRMKIQRYQTSQENQEYMQHEWPYTKQRTRESDEATYMEEFICIWCKISLQRKNPKMPDQACANSLKLDDVPQDLDNLSMLERYLISF